MASSGDFPLADPSGSTCIDRLGLRGDSEQIDDRANSQQANGEKPKNSAPDLARVEVLYARHADECEQHERVGDAGLFGC